MDERDIRRWKDEHRNDSDAALETAIQAQTHNYAGHVAAREMLHERRTERDRKSRSLDSRRFRLLMWVGILTLLATCAGVVLTAIQFFR